MDEATRPEDRIQATVDAGTRNVPVAGGPDAAAVPYDLIELPAIGYPFPVKGNFLWPEGAMPTTRTSLAGSATG